jgi:hypothetical protein
MEVMTGLLAIAWLNSSASVVAQHTLPDQRLDILEFHPVMEVVCRYECYRKYSESSDGRRCDSELPLLIVKDVLAVSTACR